MPIEALTTDPDLLERLRQSANRETTPEGRFEQRVSFVYGMLPYASTLTKGDVREMLQRMDAA